MINNKEFVDRLQKMLDYYSESASSFAQKIGVQRSSISHILSGRNKPSLEFILKVLSQYPEADLYWLLNGKGVFPKNSAVPPAPTPVKKVNTQDLFTEETQKNEEAKQTEYSTTPNEVLVKSLNTQQKPIERIVIFFKDGSFKSYEDI